MKPQYRCSSLPRIMSCTASAGQPEIAIDASGEDAAIGQAVHEVLAQVVVNGLDAPHGSYKIGAKYNVDQSEVDDLAWRGVRMWWELRGRLNHIGAESDMKLTTEDFELSGHADVIAGLTDDHETIVIIDWKTGFKEANYLPQLKGYALLSSQEHQDAAKFKCIIAWVRHGLIEVFDFSREEITEFYEEIKHLKDGGKVYSPSESNCQYCPMQTDCPARRKLLESAGRDMLVISSQPAGEITPAKLAALYPQSRMLKKALADYENELRKAVDANGPLPAGDGYEIGFEESERMTIGYRPDILQHFIPESELADLEPTIRREGLAAGVSANAPRGTKAAAIKACLDELETAGAIKKNTVKSLKYRKIIKEE